eukprot:TRINITY_DN2519_c1_g1_i1.p2 TRINITY_DN2519_c1_g1~~TRINITY_DN2519_c1_g1_i1.p2  ORF type:complete len:117 (-),score=13.22 TRINITY_DN2519_c1_g1_i1:354-668(-)
MVKRRVEVVLVNYLEEKRSFEQTDENGKDLMSRLKSELKRDDFVKIRSALIDYKADQSGVKALADTIIKLLKGENTRHFLKDFVPYIPEKFQEYFRVRIQTILG